MADHTDWMASRIAEWLRHAAPDGLTERDLYRRSGARNLDGSFCEGFTREEVAQSLERLRESGRVETGGWYRLDRIWTWREDADGGDSGAGS